MRTENFSSKYNAIKLYCRMAKEGFIVVEINSIIIKEEFINKISNDFNVEVKKLNELIGVEPSYDTDSIILIDEFNDKDSSDTVKNLNYNRNWFLSLHKNIIFVLKTETVTRLIQYSSSFWSFVNIHKEFIFSFSGIIRPHFLIDDFDFELDGLARLRPYENEPQIGNSKTTRIANLIEKSFLCAPKSNGLTASLHEQLTNIDREDEEDILCFCSAVIKVGEDLRKQSFIDEAFECVEFVKNAFTISDTYSVLKHRISKLTAEIYYADGKYGDALREYENAMSIIANYPNPYYSDLKMAILSNNIGVVYYEMDDFHNALDCFEGAIRTINDSDSNVAVANFLFNLCLLNYQIGDKDNAIYYIDTAIKDIKWDGTRSSNISISMCKVLKAYVMISLGELNNAHYLLKESLEVLRQELSEDCWCVMEAHYVFAVLYLHLNELSSAERCALKALAIMKKIRCSLKARAHIRELLGEVYFYKGDFVNAKNYLKIAYSHARGKDVFEDDVLEWMSNAIKKCEDI